LGNDTEGDDWFILNNYHYENYYGLGITFYLNNELFLGGEIKNSMVFFPNGTQTMTMQSAFARLVMAPANLSEAATHISQALLNDIQGLEIRLNMTLTPYEVFDFENGRRGIYCNVNGTLEKGRPVIPIQGLLTNHQGFAAWNADGTGPESKKYGHDLLSAFPTFYYLASRDYGGIDADPAASLARIIESGIDGFLNFKLQLAYRGFTTEQLKITMGLSDIEEDIENEDWTATSSSNTCNYYHSWIKVLLNNEPLFGMVFDTLKTAYNAAYAIPARSFNSVKAYVYDASAGSSTAVQMVAKSFFRDLSFRQLEMELSTFIASSGFINLNGRTGAFWQINNGQFIASKGPGTYVSEGTVFGEWTTQNHPYYVTGELTVPEGYTLTIAPGVTVKFTDRFLFNVKGTILAEGNSENTGGIIFTAANPDRGWGHLEMNDIAESNGMSKFNWCMFERGYAAVSTYHKGSGAISIRNTNLVSIDNCIFRLNEARAGILYHPNGGAIGLQNSSPTITNSVFYSNNARFGGAIDCNLNSSPVISRCLFYDNYALVAGGAIVVDHNSSPTLINNTITNNSTSYYGGGIIVSAQSNPVLVNNILWGNTAKYGNQISVKTADCNVYMSYCDLESGLEGIEPYGIGNGTFIRCLVEDPLFIDNLANNYLLDSITPSLCINAGSPYVPVDPDGSCSDIGVYCQSVASVVGFNPVESGQVQFRPNPFNGSTLIVFSFPGNQPAVVNIFNTVGSKVFEVESSCVNPGEYQVFWNASGLPGGIYLCRIQCGQREITRKIIKLK